MSKDIAFIAGILFITFGLYLAFSVCEVPYC
jgi:putative Ca2+/H+ antiporter (TMEM165/GDT1 family)